MIRKNKAVFLDRDGTVIEDKGYAFDASGITFKRGAVAALKKLSAAGYLLIMVTNQSGIARGLFTEDDLNAFHATLLRRLEERGVKIDDVYYCPHYKEGTIGKYAVDCTCRKPKTGLFERAIKDYSIDVSKSFAIGDNLRDCAICKVGGCRGLLFTDVPYESEAVRGVTSWAECEKIILGE